MTLTLREKLGIDITVLMRVARGHKVSEKQRVEIYAKYVKENYPQLSKEEAIEFLLNVAWRQIRVLPKIADICKGAGK